MSNPSVQRSHFWVFDEQQLEDALDAAGEHVVSSGGCMADVDRVRRTIRDFLHSDQLAERGMRRGGTDDT